REIRRETWNNDWSVRQIEREPADSAGDHAGTHPGHPANQASALPTRSTDVPRKSPGKRRQRLTVASGPKDQWVVEADKPREVALPPLPAPGIKPQFGTLVSFAICVLIPILLAWIYYGAFASAQYSSEFRFTVKDTSTGAASASSGLVAMIAGTGLGSS